jgi:alpha-ketoglutarate-dependent taurine dioxygenase
MGDDESALPLRRRLGTRVDVRPSAAIADRTARARVSAALAKHGVISLAAEPGLTPSQLARFTHLLCADAGGGTLVATTSDTYDACVPCSAVEGGVESGAEPEPGVALVLSNVMLEDADAAGIHPMYRARLNDTHAGVDSRLAAVWHQDEQFRRLPCAFTLLYPVRTPPPGIADTHFADTALGWDTLPASL